MKATSTHQAATTHETRCLKCHRLLRCPSPDGYGPKCRAKLRRAARNTELTQYKETLLAKAVELIEQGGLVPLRKNRVFTVSSSDGTTTYKAARQGCTCPAGIKGRYVCYHRIAAHIVSLAA